MNAGAISRTETATITYLRGLAALGVAFLHVRTELWIGWRELWSSGSATLWEKAASLLSIPTPFLGSGVTLFFLLSGFCIALPHTPSSGREIRWGEYGMRRFFRIYPPYFAAVAFTFALQWIISLVKPGVESSFASYTATLALIQNYTTGSPAANGALWSVPVEVELYLAFPVVYYLLRRLGIRALLIFTGTVSLAAWVGVELGISALSVCFVKYWLLWSVGAVMAELFVSNRLGRPSLWMIFVGFAALGLAVAAQVQRGGNFAFIDVFYGAFFCVILWFGLGTEHFWRDRVPRWIAVPLAMLGACSYSLYLVHYPFFHLSGALWVHWFGEKPANFFVSVGFVLLAIVIAWGFYLLVELPSHRMAKNMARRLADRRA